MDIRSICMKAYGVIRYTSRRLTVKHSNKEYFDTFAKNGIKRVRLTAEQKKQVDEIWSRYGRYTYGTHELHLSVTGKFIPEIVPEDLFYCSIFSHFNNEKMTFAFSDKNYFERLVPAGNFPKAILHCSDGIKTDSEYRAVTDEQANEILAGTLAGKGSFIVKPSKISGKGAGVKLYNAGDPVDIAEIDKISGDDYIVQEKIIQHPDFAALNPTSVNIIRMNTVFTNGKPSVLMASMRVGGKGQITDYSIPGKQTGNVIIGIKEDGTFRDVCYQPCGIGSNVTSCGYEFGGKKIPGWEKICQMALRCHEQMPDFKWIGWDMVLDADGEPVIVEYNCIRPGVLYYQWVNGGLLGDTREKIYGLLDSVNCHAIR